MNVALSARAHASILLEIAARTIAEARTAWTAAQGADDETTLRAAYRACLFAARSSRKAAAAWAHDSRGHRLTIEAKRLDDAATGLLARLARVAA